MAYVIAHEVGHHVQNELNILSAYHQKRATVSTKEANALTVRLELQADYYAGAWAKYVDGQGLLDAGDIDEAMNAAHAVGDDTLQKNLTAIPFQIASPMVPPNNASAGFIEAIPMVT